MTLIEDMCAYCTQGYADGQRDCGVILCPIYKMMPYRKKSPTQIPKAMSQALVEVILKCKQRAGKREYIQFLKGEYISQGSRIKAKCYDCMGFFEDGAVSCCNTKCPLFARSPYREKFEQEEASSKED
jgi:hypothetical protein